MKIGDVCLTVATCFSGAVQSVRHFQVLRNGTISSCEYARRLVLGILELIPVFGGLIALVEKVCFLTDRKFSKPENELGLASSVRDGFQLRDMSDHIVTLEVVAQSAKQSGSSGSVTAVVEKIIEAPEVVPTVILQRAGAGNDPDELQSEVEGADGSGILEGPEIKGVGAVISPSVLVRIQSKKGTILSTPARKYIFNEDDGEEISQINHAALRELSFSYKLSGIVKDFLTVNQLTEVVTCPLKQSSIDFLAKSARKLCNRGREDDVSKEVDLTEIAEFLDKLKESDPVEYCRLACLNPVKLGASRYKIVPPGGVDYGRGFENILYMTRSGCLCVNDVFVPMLLEMFGDMDLVTI